MMGTILLLITALFSFVVGYNFGRRAEKWSQNHTDKKEYKDFDGVKHFLDNLNKN